MRSLPTPGLLIAVMVMSSPAHAQGGLQVVRPIPGYVCLALNLNEQQMFSLASRVPILESPAPTAKPIGYASATVIASTAPPTNGFQQVLKLDAVPGWISTSYLKPWKNLGSNGHRCIPSLMSNGRIGFGFE